MILSIQYLRALAACMVVFFHAADSLVKYFSVPPIYALGAAGVDIFFVISGLIMWLTISPASFMWRRITRIVPLYWLVTLVSSPCRSSPARLPAVFIVLGALYLDRHGAVRNVRVLRLLGDASYSLYLTHLFAVGAVAVVWQKFDLWHSIQGGMGFFLAAVGAGVVLGVLTYLYVETPLLNLSRIGRPKVAAQRV